MGLAEPVEVGAGLAGELDDVLEARGRHEHGLRALALEQGVGRGGRAVGELADVVSRSARPLEHVLNGVQDAFGACKGWPISTPCCHQTLPGCFQATLRVLQSNTAGGQLHSGFALLHRGDLASLDPLFPANGFRIGEHHVERDAGTVVQAIVRHAVLGQPS